VLYEATELLKSGSSTIYPSPRARISGQPASGLIVISQEARDLDKQQALAIGDHYKKPQSDASGLLLVSAS
jgi:hypothetical protein